MENDESLSVSQCWKNYNIAKCITNTKELVDEIKSSTINACWQKLWQDAVLENITPAADKTVMDIVLMAHKIEVEGFNEIRTSDIQ